jgi:hypothetical protein
MKKATPDYTVQGMYSDGRICIEMGFYDEAQAIAEAQILMKACWFEGDSVRVITRDCELVYSSAEGE